VSQWDTTTRSAHKGPRLPTDRRRLDPACADGDVATSSRRVCCRARSVGNERIHSQREGRGCTVLDPNENPNVQNPAGWAVNQATAELYDVDDPDVILERARELVREAEQLRDERHDEYDDPDQGGEA
jgi:hypothetical protein